MNLLTHIQSCIKFNCMESHILLKNKIKFNKVLGTFYLIVLGLSLTLKIY